MKYQSARPLVSLLFIITIVGSASAQQLVNVTGSVGDPLSVPIPAARITLYSFERVLQTTSDSSGHFQFNAVPAGNYEFEVMAPGFKRYTRQVSIAVEKRKRDQPLELPVAMEVGLIGSPQVINVVTEVAPTGSCAPPDAVTYGPRTTSKTEALSGIVINRYPNMPVAGATLELFDAGGARLAQQQTNERGEFEFKQTAPGRYQIAFQHPGYQDTKSTNFWVARENATHITMQAVQKGKVVVCQ